MKTPLISVVTATYNSEEFLEQTILSLQCQTYPHLEHIVIDGGSKDHTLDIIARYRDNIAYFVSETDNGIYDAFNKGVRAAKGDIVFFLSSDDYLYDERVLEDVAKVFQEEPSIRALHGNIAVPEEGLGQINIQGCSITLKDLMNMVVPQHPAFFARRELFEQHNLFDLQYRIASDIDFMVKCFRGGEQQIRYLDRIIAVHRLGGISTHISTKATGMREFEAIIKKHFGPDQDAAYMDQVNQLFRLWLETLLLHDKPISSSLYKAGIQSVAVFGTMKTALYLVEDLRRAGIRVEALLDNNKHMQEKVIAGVPVKSPQWLLSYKNVQAVILSIDSNRDKEVKLQLADLSPQTPVYSWKELVRDMTGDKP